MIKRLPAAAGIQADHEITDALNKKLGEGNVKIRETLLTNR